MKNNLEAQFVHDFFESLPNKPYCTDRLGVTHIRAKKTAVKKQYVQINRRNMVRYLIIDIDRNGSVMAWYDEHLPSPTWTTMNRLNGHCHIVFKLKDPVCTSDIAHLAPLKFLAAIESALTERLNGDRGYAGLLTKNPLHDEWQTTFWSNREYTLNELADFLDLRGHPRKGVEASGLGRNCVLFDSVRLWAYKEIRKFWSPDYKAKWSDAVYERVAELNAQFSVPLSTSEIKSIAKSIANWTYRHFTPTKYHQIKAEKGRIGGLIGGKLASREDKAKAGALGGKVGGVKSKGGGRKSQKDKLLPKVLQMIDQGYNQSAIAEDLGISTRSIIRWLKSM